MANTLGTGVVHTAIVDPVVLLAALLGKFDALGDLVCVGWGITLGGG